MKQLFSIALLALFAAGCANVPANKVSYTSPTGEKFTIDNPKQWSSSNLTLTLPGGASLKADKIDSANDANVLQVIANQNMVMGQQLIQAMQMLQQMIATGAAKAATGGIAP